MKLHRKWFGLLIAAGAGRPDARTWPRRTRRSPSPPYRAPRTRASRRWRRCTTRRPASRSTSSSRRTQTSTRSSSTAFEANDATYDLVMLDDPWMPKFGTMTAALSDLGAAGHRPGPDIAQIVWDVGTWPPPHGAVPPSRGRQAAAAPRRDRRGQRRDVHVPLRHDARRRRHPTTTCWPTRRRRTRRTSLATSSAARRPTRVVATSCRSCGRSAATSSTRTGTSSSTATRRSRPVKFLVDDLKRRRPGRPGRARTPPIATAHGHGQGYQSSVWPGEINTAVFGRGLDRRHDQGSLLHPHPQGPERQGRGHDGQLDAGHPQGLAEPAGGGRLHQVDAAGRHAEDLRPEQRHPVAHERPQGPNR